MSAKTRWWFCGDCGFRNHPRQDAGDPERNEKCEQCGASRELEDAADYEPRP